MKAIELKQNTVKRLVGPLVHRTLSPRMFQFVRFGSWCLSLYFPRLVTSWFVKRTPQIRSFGAAPTRVRPCEATSTCERVGSDKVLSRDDQARERQRSGAQLHHSIFGALQGAPRPAAADL